MISIAILNDLSWNAEMGAFYPTAVLNRGFLTATDWSSSLSLYCSREVPNWGDDATIPEVISGAGRLYDHNFGVLLVYRL